MIVQVSNIDRTTDEDDLWKLFEEFGELVSVELNEDPDPGEDTFTAYVEMESDEEAEAAIDELDGEQIDGRLLKVGKKPEVVMTGEEGSGEEKQVEEPFDPLDEEDKFGKGGWERIEKRSRKAK